MKDLKVNIDYIVNLVDYNVVNNSINWCQYKDADEILKAYLHDETIKYILEDEQEIKTILNYKIRKDKELSNSKVMNVLIERQQETDTFLIEDYKIKRVDDIINKSLRSIISRQEQEEMENWQEFNYKDFKNKTIEFIENNFKKSVYDVEFTRYDLMKINKFTALYIVNL